MFMKITCNDRNGNIVKRVTSSDEGDVEDPDGNGGNTPGGNTPGGSQTGGGSQAGGTEGGTCSATDRLISSKAQSSIGPTGSRPRLAAA